MSRFIFLLATVLGFIMVSGCINTRKLAEPSDPFATMPIPKMKPTASTTAKSNKPWMPGGILPGQSVPIAAMVSIGQNQLATIDGKSLPGIPNNFENQ